MSQTTKKQKTTSGTETKTAQDLPVTGPAKVSTVGTSTSHVGTKEHNESGFKAALETFNQISAVNGNLNSGSRCLAGNSDWFMGTTRNENIDVTRHTRANSQQEGSERNATFSSQANNVPQQAPNSWHSQGGFPAQYTQCSPEGRNSQNPLAGNYQQARYPTYDNSFQCSTQGNSAQFLNPDSNGQYSTPGNNFQHSIPGSDCQYLTQNNNVQYSTTGNNFQYSTSGNNTQYSTQSNNAQYSTPGNNFQYSTSGNNAQFSTQSNNVQYSTPGNNVQFSSSRHDDLYSTSGNNAQYSTQDKSAQNSTQGNSAQNSTQGDSAQNSTPCNNGNSWPDNIDNSPHFNQIWKCWQSANQQERGFTVVYHYSAPNDKFGVNSMHCVPQNNFGAIGVQGGSRNNFGAYCMPNGGHQNYFQHSMPPMCWSYPSPPPIHYPPPSINPYTGMQVHHSGMSQHALPWWPVEPNQPVLPKPSAAHCNVNRMDRNTEYGNNSASYCSMDSGFSSLDDAGPINLSHTRSSENSLGSETFSSSPPSSGMSSAFSNSDGDRAKLPDFASAFRGYTCGPYNSMEPSAASRSFEEPWMNNTNMY